MYDDGASVSVDANSQMTDWLIDGDWLVSRTTRMRLARIVQGGIALYDKRSHDEIILTSADIEALLRQAESGSSIVMVSTSAGSAGYSLSLKG